jgi:Holliday junction resolvasome RuvABC endonuclease subunit
MDIEIANKFNNTAKGLIRTLRNTNIPANIEDIFKHVNILMETKYNELILLFIEHIYNNVKFRTAILKNNVKYFLNSKNISKDKTVIQFIKSIRIVYIKSKICDRKNIFIYLKILLKYSEKYKLQIVEDE